MPGLSVNLTRRDFPLPAGEEQYSLIVTAEATQALGAYDLTVNATVGDSTKSQPFSVKLVSDLVIMKNTLYDPANLTVRVGTTVVWLNLEDQICMCDPGTHDVVFSGGFGSSGPMAQFDAYSHTFTQVGTFRYYCSYHPGMTGLVVVSGK